MRRSVWRDFGAGLSRGFDGVAEVVLTLAVPLLVIVAVWLAVALVLLSAGCGATARTTPPTALASRVVEKTAPDGTVTKTTVTGSANGTGQSASGDKVDTEMDSEPATVEILGAAGDAGDGGVIVSGGGGRGKAAAKAASGLAVRFVAGAVGALSLLGAGVMLYFGRVRGGVVLGLVGAGAVLVAVWPWLLVPALLAAAAVVAGPYVMAEWKAKGDGEGLRMVMEVINDLDEGARSAFSEMVRRRATPGDYRAVRAVRRSDELTNITL